MSASEKIIGEKETIWIGEDGIVRILPHAGFEFDKEDVQRRFDSYEKLGIGKTNKSLLLAVSSTDFVMTKEARDFASEKAKD